MYALVTIGLWRVPFEDAAILMRYADNLAHGYGIVWNIGGAPVDGATDFLFMVFVAGLVKLGFSTAVAIRLIGVSSHAILTLLVYGTSRLVWKSSILPALFSALYLAMGTGLGYTFAFFGTSFFALSAALTWLLGLLLMRPEKSSRAMSIAFAVSGLITGLIRPEGVIFVSLMLVAVILLKGIRASRLIIIYFVSIFILFGGTYFLWHWLYFGYPLPNTFYRKQVLILGGDSLYFSLASSFRFCAPFLVAFLLGLRSRRTARLTFAFLIPPVGFTLAFVLISSEMNFGARYQYPVLPVVLMSWYPLVKSIGTEFEFFSRVNRLFLARLVFRLAAVALAGGLIYYSTLQNCTISNVDQPNCRVAYEARGLYDVGIMLSNYTDKGYVLATSEAGLLPYYSRWEAVDTWGLNDSWITHNGGITEQYLAQYKPDIIVFHARFSPASPPLISEETLADPWFRMTIVLKEYAEKHGYTLAAVFGDSVQDTHYYYVRSDFPDSAEIIRRLQNMNYYWHSLQIPAKDYAEYIQP